MVPEILVMAPGGVDGAVLAAAAGRAEALGLLDLAGVEVGAARVAIARLAGCSRATFGIRVDPSWILEDETPETLRVVLLAGPGAVASRRRPGRTVLVEIRDREEAREAIAAGADGLVVAGHEAGGRCGREATFVLLQAALAEGATRVWARGGIGPRSATACMAMGATGVVLDGAVLLAREAAGLLDGTHPRNAGAVARLDGGETTVIGPPGAEFRVFAPPGAAALAALREAAEFGGPAWDEAVAAHVGWDGDRAWPIGQDAAFAAELARRHRTVGGIVAAVRVAIREGIAASAEIRPLAPGSPLAESHGTAYPIVQGPMTRVSDTPAFAQAVARDGALPLLALAMLRGPEVAGLLRETAGALGDRPWGVGLLGFVDPELRQEQVAAVRDARPRFALIAGGRPDQAAELERDGIATYLHAPSPGLLSRFVRDGARRFVLEGRECGGHVGPRSSLVLWEQAVDALLDAIASGVIDDPDALHVLFAGGLHDGRSAAGVAALAAPLAAAGAKVGVLVGTAYLFTREAVATGAIVPRFQGEAVACRRTVLLRTGPGHEVRVAPSPFADHFAAERHRLTGLGISAEATREELERLNAGRLRLAAKGLERVNGVGSPVVARSESDQYERGVYMLGEVATLRDEITTIAALHRAISDGSTRSHAERTPPAEARPEPSDIAIVGLSGIFPDAADLRTFWENTLRGRDCIVEIPPDRWDWRPYYDANPKAPDKVVSKWGGFVPDVPFDPIRYGLPPASLPSIEPAQLLVLEATRMALDDAGYATREFPRERTAVVLGMGGGAAQLAMGYAFRSYLPMLEAAAPEVGAQARAAAEPLLPEWTEDSFPGFLLNVTAGRVANRFNLGGANYTVDAACGSSLAALALAVRELESRSADMVILGGADTVQNPFTYLAFSKTQAFSPRGRSRPFDASADGIVISEGVGVAILKRLADAERDGDRIYAVIKGVGAGSDGRVKGLTAPSEGGQRRALSRAYEKAQVDPTTLGYVEAHGTGTAVGDVTEANALAGFLRDAGARPASVAVGSVKSMIGHTKCAAGLAGLINASLALHHRVLPPTIGVVTPNPKADLGDGPLHVSTRPRPWLHAEDTPRRAGVSALGFGGTNFHAVLEAYEADPSPRPAPRHEWPVELLLWRAANREELIARVDRVAARVADGATPRLRDLAHTLALDFEVAQPGATLAIVADSLADFAAKWRANRESVAAKAEHSDPRGVSFAATPAFAGAPVAFLFPGQGSQHLDMMGDLAFHFDEVRSSFEIADRSLVAAGRPPVGPKVFPPTTLNDDARERARLALQATEVAQPAVGAASVGVLRLLDALGIRPDLAAGHSYGELVALHAADAIGEAELATLSEIRGRLMIAAAGPEPGTMAALAAGAEAVAELLRGLDGVTIANHNGPKQTVISGTRDAVIAATERARNAGIRAFDLPVACAFHSPLVSGAARPLAARAAESIRRAPSLPVFANLDARPHPNDPGAIADRLGKHLAAPVRFAPMIDAMHASGARVFVECGPGSILTNLVGPILGDRPHLALAVDSADRPGLPTLLRTLARLATAGVALHPERLTADRGATRIDLDSLAANEPPISPTSWLVNGSRARPQNAPEPRRLGQAPEILGVIARPNPAPPTLAKAPSHAPTERNGHERPAMTTGKPEAAALPPRPVESIGLAAQPAAAPAIRPDSTRVIESFQETMRLFLEVQQATMLAYLSGRSPGPVPALPSTSAVLPEIDTPRRVESPPATNGHHAANGKAPKPAKPAVADATPKAPIVEPPTAAEPVVVAPAESIADRLAAIVRDRTGYPIEMLGPDLDLEADLGIDSIKRVEILGTLRDCVPNLDRAATGPLMNVLSRAKTLGQIVERVESALRGTPKPEAVAEPKPAPAAPAEPPAKPLRRLVLQAVDAALPAERPGLVPGGLVLVTGNPDGVAREIVDRLNAEGHPAEIVDPSGLDADALETLRDDRPLTGIIHARPLDLRDVPGLDPAAWSARLDDELRGLVRLAKLAADDLEQSARRGGACLIAATGMGGEFASTGKASSFFAGQGSIAGLVKTLAREWPAVRTRVVDLDPAAPVAEHADRLVAEAMADDGWPEVGYAGGRRVRLRATTRPLSQGGPTLEIAEGQPILVTGGARGITAAVAEAIARRWRPTLLLLGSSPSPDDREDPAFAGLTEPASLKAALLERLRREGRPVGPADLERSYKALTKAREIRATIARIRDLGAKIEYARADVRDPAELGRVLATWRSRHGDPVGLIHGAGVIHDKLLRNKTSESFDHVLGTKLDGALNLARLLNPKALHFTAFFSSVAGRFGNEGQADYAAANEGLNKLALWLDRRWPGRVVSVNWGPWSGVGMVSDLVGHLGRRGLGMIPPAEGCEALVEEIRRGRKGEVEVVLAGELGTLEGPLPIAARPRQGVGR